MIYFYLAIYKRFLSLREYAQMYDVLKGERNKCVAYIQTTTQKAAEMREKIKILQNEVEILQASIATKDRQKSARSNYSHI